MIKLYKEDGTELMKEHRRGIGYRGMLNQWDREVIKLMVRYENSAIFVWNGNNIEKYINGDIVYENQK